MRFDRYLAVEWLKVFVLTFISILGLLLLDDIQDDLRDLLGYGASFTDALLYYLIRTPSFIPTVLPVSFLISLLFTLGAFHQNQEVIAMRAAGCNLWRITRSLWILGAILTLVLFQLNAKIVPWSTESSKEIWNNHKFKKELTEKKAEEEVGLIYNLTFFNSKENRLWFIDRFNQYNYRAYGITISILDSLGREENRIAANEGFYDDFEARWVLKSGRNTEFIAETGEAIRNLPFGSNYVLEFSEDPSLMKLLENRPKDLSFWELSSVIQFIDAESDSRINPYSVEFYGRLFNPFACIIVLGLAIPFALSGIRTNPLVGVSKAMGFFVLYYLLLTFSQLLGRGLISPVLAALLPNLIALLGVFFLLRKFKKPA